MTVVMQILSKGHNLLVKGRSTSARDKSHNCYMDVKPTNMYHVISELVIMVKSLRRSLRKILKNSSLEEVQTRILA